MAKKSSTTIPKKTVLFVCTGNTCRSPMAQAIFNNYLKTNKIKGYKVSSAGIFAARGDVLSANAAKALTDMGIEFKHSAKTLSYGMIDTSDYIICMTQKHKDAVNSDKATTIAQITGGNDVPDPFGQSLEVYKSVAEYLQYACEDILNYIKSNNN